VILDGHFIPKNAQVIPNLYAVHMDPELWEEPEKFNPERFLNSEGEVEKPEFFMPFGVGRRMCLGAVLARHQLFLFFSSLVHTYDLVPAEGCFLPDLVGESAVTTIPGKYKVKFD
jgi:26-hydroxylase